MKVHVDDKLVLELNDTQKKVIRNDIPDEIFEEDMHRRVSYILTHKYERCFDRLKKEWEPKLSSRYGSIPTNPDVLAELIFTQPDYKSRTEKDKMEKA